MTANSDQQAQQAQQGEGAVDPGTAAAAGPASVPPVPEAPAGDQPPQPSAPEPIGPHAAPASLRRTRLGGLWLMLSLGAVVLVLLLVFILMNGQRIEIHVYGGHWNAPLGVALLFAAALGVLLVLVPGAGRIIQLKRAARKLHREREHLVTRLDQANADAYTDPDAEAPTTPAG